jgi:MFS family permease
MAAAEPLFSARFFAMCAFTFTVFVSAFMLFPTAPFQILAMGGSESQAGLFLGFLTYASALSAPLTGAIADRIGKKRMLVACSLAIACFSAGYALSGSARALLLVVPFHGLFWSGLLSASSAYMTDILPEQRRAEGIGYWGLSTMFAVAVAPGIGFVLLRHGWVAVCAACGAMNLVMAAIAGSLVASEGASAASARPLLRSGLVEWRVVALSLTLFLYSFGYGGITSFAALFAEHSGIAPKGIYFPVLALVIILTRPTSGRLADRIGHRKVFVPCLALIAIGLFVLAFASSRALLVLSALVFGAGFGTAYPAYAAYVMKHVTPDRRGAAFGAILAAFDTGIGTGSIATGWLIDHFGYATAFGSAALLSTLSIPYFLFAERRFLRPG